MTCTNIILVIPAKAGIQKPLDSGFRYAAPE